ncbi:MAG: hypothetical protein J1F18_14925 [Lachnospiraceae bacterium]|nr:hypothetical protein [Lachnospiraceae bacterium]
MKPCRGDLAQVDYQEGGEQREMRQRRLVLPGTEPCHASGGVGGGMGAATRTKESRPGVGAPERQGGIGLTGLFSTSIIAENEEDFK